MVEVGRREEGEGDLFKASLNGEGEVVFLASLEYMVMVSADAAYSPKANIYSCIGAVSHRRLPSAMLARSIGFLRLHSLASVHKYKR